MSLGSSNLVLKARRIPGELMVFSLYRNPEEEVGSNAAEIPPPTSACALGALGLKVCVTTPCFHVLLSDLSPESITQTVGRSSCFK